MRYVGRERGKVKIQPPMTPMIDIIFQLLLYFLLTPMFQANEAYLTTNLPKTQGPNLERQTDIPRIKIELLDEPPETKNVSILLNETEALGANFEALEGRLRQLQAQGLAPDYPVLIAPTMAVRHKWVVQAFDKAVAARFKAIHFAVPR